ncbi:MAG: hypothetical protein JWM68_1941 [Verrucomicrobiales bacterium]|nr:hypothetical protein [Verrucomicrobiales bacterium]
MKTLLHNPITHLFLKHLGEWTLDPDKAMQFADVSEAQKYCHAHHLNGVQLFLRFDPPDYDAIAERQGEGLMYEA